MIDLSAELEQASLPEALKIVVKQFPEGAVFSSSFGQEDQVITDTIWRNSLPVKVFTLDTGRLFQETYDLMDSTKARYKKDFAVYFPEYGKVEEYVAEHGFNGFYDSVENRKSCCHIRKVEPLNRALQGAEVWITGLRADQSDNRSNKTIWEWDEHRQLYKFNPLIHWHYKEVLDYLQENNVPYNRLHDRGFVSIGCAPCTRAIEPGEPSRAGRWWWETSKKECGLHE